MIRRLMFLVLAAVLLWPVAAYAQDVNVTEDDDILIRINGPVNVAADQTFDVIVAISNEATVDGVVSEALVIVNGTAMINGRVDGDVVVINGDLILGPAAVVEDVTLYQSDIVRDPAATISGTLEESGEISFSFWGSAFVSFVFWLGLTIVVLVAGILFALFGARQLLAMTVSARTAIGGSLITALALFVGLPILAIAAFISVIGIPLGLAIFLVVIPLLWFAGYIVMGATLGIWIRSLFGRADERSGLVWATLIGILVLQVIGLIPFIGGLIAFLAGLYGSGVLIYHLIRRRGADPVAVSASPAARPLTS